MTWIHFYYCRHTGIYRKQGSQKKRLLAYKNVKIFKSDMQGVADSLAYIPKDSTLHMYTQPILWNNENQMTADSIYMVLKNKR